MKLLLVQLEDELFIDKRKRSPCEIKYKSSKNVTKAFKSLNLGTVP